EKKKEEKTEWEMDAEWKAEMLQEDGKLIVEEESSKEHISWGSIKMYLVVLGGRYWMIFWPAFTFAIVFECGIEVLQPWLLGAWAMEYTIHPDPADMDVTFYLVGYVLLVCLMLTVFFVAQTTLALGALRASALLHKWLIKTILRTTLWTLQPVNTTIPDLFSHMFEIGIIIIVQFIAILIYMPTIGLFALIIFVVGSVQGVWDQVGGGP
ncbi:hypothetical protein C0989_007211, partial [Termitomyces sp. Mn162]